MLHIWENKVSIYLNSLFTSQGSFFPRKFLGERISHSSCSLRSCNMRGCSECNEESGGGVLAVMSKVKLLSRKFSCSEITLLFVNTMYVCYMLSPRCVSKHYLFKSLDGQFEGIFLIQMMVLFTDHFSWIFCWIAVKNWMEGKKILCSTNGTNK